MIENGTKETSLTHDSSWEEAYGHLIENYFKKEEVQAFLEDFLSWHEPPNAALRWEHSPHPEDEEQLISIETQEIRKAQMILGQSRVSHVVLEYFLADPLVQGRLQQQWEREAKSFPNESAGFVLKEAVRGALGSLIADSELTLYKGEDEFPGQSEAEVKSIWAFSNFLFRYFSEKLPDT